MAAYCFELKEGCEHGEGCDCKDAQKFLLGLANFGQHTFTVTAEEAFYLTMKKAGSSRNPTCENVNKNTEPFIMYGVLYHTYQRGQWTDEEAQQELEAHKNFLHQYLSYDYGHGQVIPGFTYTDFVLAPEYKEGERGIPVALLMKASIPLNDLKKATRAPHDHNHFLGFAISPHFDGLSAVESTLNRDSIILVRDVDLKFDAKNAASWRDHIDWDKVKWSAKNLR